MTSGDGKLPLSRRKLILAGAAGLGPAPVASARNTTSPRAMPNTSASLEDNIYTRLLGVRPHIGAHEHITSLGGVRIRPEVMDAMAQANDFFVNMEELSRAAGRRAADLMGAPAALVTAGGFAALELGAAACMTGGDQAKIEQLPHPTFARRICLMQTCQRYDYDRAYSLAGAEIVTVETRADMAARLAQGDVAFVGIISAVDRQKGFGLQQRVDRATPPDPNLIPHEELIALAHSHNTPVIVDMASDMPPWDRFQRFLDAKADLIVVSGGKVIGGPQSSGLLLGRDDLIAAAAMQSSPHVELGRGMKVGKEEIVGLIVALESFIKSDKPAIVARWNAMAEGIVARLQDIPGLKAEFAMNVCGFGDAYLTWDPAVIGLDRAAVRQAMVEGSPKIIGEGINGPTLAGTMPVLTIRTRLLRDGEDRLVAERLRTIFL